MKKYTIQKIIAVVCLVFIIPLAYSIKLLGAVTTPSVYFEPGTSALPTNQTLSLRINSDTNKVGFVRISFAFDKTKINLSGEITHSLPFDTEIEKTSMVDANKLGAARIVVAVTPSKAALAPSGTFEVAQIPLHVLSTTSNDATVVIFNKDDIQLVDMQNHVLSSTIENPAYTLNLSETPTDTQTPPVTTTSTPFVTNTITPSNTVASTNSPTVTFTPIPTNTNTPTVTLSPTNTPTSTPTPTQTLTPTSTQTPVPTATSDVKPATTTNEITQTITYTPTATLTVSPTPIIQNNGNRFGWFKKLWNNFRSRFSFFSHR
jgi:hypothetical protein